MLEHLPDNGLTHLYHNQELPKELVIDPGLRDQGVSTGLKLQNGPVFAEIPTMPVNTRTQHAVALGITLKPMETMRRWIPKEM